jgi:hypothetical protein
MLKMTTSGWCVWEGHEKDGVDIFWTKSLCEGVAVCVDMKKWIGWWKRAKGGPNNGTGVGRVETMHRRVRFGKVSTVQKVFEIKYIGINLQ